MGRALLPSLPTSLSPSLTRSLPSSLFTEAYASEHGDDNWWEDLPPFPPADRMKETNPLQAPGGAGDDDGSVYSTNTSMSTNWFLEEKEEEEESIERSDWRSRDTAGRSIIGKGGSVLSVSITTSEREEMRKWRKEEEEEEVSTITNDASTEYDEDPNTRLPVFNEELPPELITCDIQRGN